MNTQKYFACKVMISKKGSSNQTLKRTLKVTDCVLVTEYTLKGYYRIRH